MKKKKLIKIYERPALEMIDLKADVSLCAMSPFEGPATHQGYGDEDDFFDDEEEGL